MKTMACIDADTLSQLLQQSLTGEQQRQCELHIEMCSRCQSRLEQMAGSPEWWQNASSMLSSREVVTPQTADETRSRLDGVGAGGDKAVLLKQVRQILDPAGHPEMLGRLGGYEIESLIGQGGFGIVFKAHDSELNRPVAIKVLAPHLSTSGVARRRFAREAQAAAAVVHPNVVPIHAVYSEAECPYLVMTYVPGYSLQQFVQQHGPVDAKSIVRIAQQVAAGLAAAHRQGLVHRDIKPGNILLENGLSRALITDFGLARAADDAAASQTGWLAGTPHYMSPEQAAGGDLDGRSDLFSLGSVMYYLATGREPFRGQQPLAILQQIATQRPLSPHLVNSDVPRTLSRIIDRLLEKRPQDRIQSAQELSELLEEYLAHMQQPQVHGKPRLPRSRRQWQQLAQWTALGILFAAIGWWGIPAGWQALKADNFSAVIFDTVTPDSQWLMNGVADQSGLETEDELPSTARVSIKDLAGLNLEEIDGGLEALELKIAVKKLQEAQGRLSEFESGWKSFLNDLASTQLRLIQVERSWWSPEDINRSERRDWMTDDLLKLNQELNQLETWQWIW